VIPPSTALLLAVVTAATIDGGCGRGPWKGHWRRFGI